jgi:hypothetical protein
MKKVLASLIVLLIFMASVPLSLEAQTRCSSRVRRSTVSRYSRSRTVRPYYATQGYSYQRPSFYQRHRTGVNLAIGTGAGALIGGLLGGRRGVAIGILAGAGGGALYNHFTKKKRYYR